jgi:hypothetical protein
VSNANPLHMWTYWRDKKGLVAALEEYYPDLLAKNSELQAALTQIKTAKRAINQIMEELNNDE